MNTGKRPSIVVDNSRRSIPIWQDRIRDPSLTVLLVLQLCTIFVAAPLAAKGLPMARTVARSCRPSHRRDAVGKMGSDCCDPAGVGCHRGKLPTDRRMVACFAHDRPPRRSDPCVLSAGLGGRTRGLCPWPHYIASPSGGAMVMYLNLAVIFAAAYGLIWELIPGAFANIAAPTVDPQEVANMLYFSLTTLTTTGYGDIVPIEPFARSLANLESVIGPLFLAITVARLVSMELADRRR